MFGPDPKVKRPLLPALKWLKNKLDEAFSKIIRARDIARWGGKCPFCVSGRIECAFHFIRKSRSLKMRWDFRNAVGACMACNGHMEHNEGPFWLWYVKENGIEQFEQIQKESHGAALWSRSDHMGMLHSLEIQVAALVPGSWEAQ